MKSRILALSVLAVLSVVISSAYAAQLTVSMASALSSKALTENDQVTVAVTVTNPSGTETDIVTTLSGGWFSVVQSCNTISTLGSGASSTSTCIIKPTSTGTDLTLTARSEPSNNAANAGTGSTSGINVASQSSSLTASISGPSSVDKSATFYVGVTVTAPSANDVANAKTTISESGQCTVDTVNGPSQQQSLGNITKGTSKSPTNWRLSASSADGTCTVTVNIVSDVGGSASPSRSITVGTPSTGSSGSTGSAGGSGGSGGTSSKAKVLVGETEAIITIPSIAAKGEVNFTIDSKTLAITGLKIGTVTSVTNIKITVTKLDSRPASVVSAAPGVVSQYLTVDKVNISAGDIQNVTMDFRVEKIWVASNNINESTVSLHRYGDSTDQWEKLETKKVSEDDTNIYYQASSPGLSVFAVTGESKPSEQQPAEEETGAKETPLEILEAVKKDSWKIVVIVVIFVLVVGGLVYFLKAGLKVKK